MAVLLADLVLGSRCDHDHYVCVRIDAVLTVGPLVSASGGDEVSAVW